jgi:hypothetical protein
VAFDPALSANENLPAMRAAAAAVVAGGVHARDGRFAGVVEGERIAEERASTRSCGRCSTAS